MALPARADAPSPTVQSRLAAAYDDRDWAAILQQLRLLVVEKPGDSERVFTLLDALIRTESWREAERLVMQFQEKHPPCFSCDVIQWRIYDAKHAFDSDRIQKLRQAIQKTLRKAPLMTRETEMEFFQALYRGAEILGDGAMLTESRTEMLKRISESERKTAEYLDLAERDYLSVMRREPRISAEEFVETYPEFPQIEDVARLVLQRRTREREEVREERVREWIKRWISLQPSEPRVCLSSALALQAIGIRDRSVKKLLTKGLHLTEKDLRAGSNLAHSKFDPRQERQRLADLFRLYLAREEFLHGRVEEAYAKLILLAGRMPDECHATFFLAQAAHALRRTAEAEDAYRATIAMRCEVGESLAAISSLRKQPDLSISDLQAESRQHFSWPEFKELTDLSLQVRKAVPQGRSRWVAASDFDRDGRTDLFAGGGSGILLRNSTKQGNAGSISFSVVPETEWGGPWLETGPAVWVDIDNDGDLDLFLGNAKRKGDAFAYDRILIQQGKRTGRFRDATASWLPVAPSVPTAAATFFPANVDQRPDLYIAGYERSSPELGFCGQDRLYVNEGSSFRDVSEAAGVQTMEPLCGRGVVAADFNNDGKSDLFVANYRLDPNLLWMQTKDARFQDRAKEFGVRGVPVQGLFGHSIGAEAGDIDNDGDLDLIVGNLAHPRGLSYSDKTQVFYQDNEAGHFQDAFQTSGIPYRETQSEPALVDFDLDGDLDLLLTSVYPEGWTAVYQNDGHGNFRDVTFASGLSVNDSWGSAFADFDGDGVPDLALTSQLGLRIFRNQGIPGRHWLIVDVLDRASNAPLLGARVTVVAPDGGRQIRDIQTGRGTGSQHDGAAFFGLGESSDPRTVIVNFPGGRGSRVLEHVSPDQRLRVTDK